jgi:hypothetical protein
MGKTEIDQLKRIILSGKADDEQIRKTAWELCIANDLLVGRIRMRPPAERFQNNILRKVLAGEFFDSTTRTAWTSLPHLVLNDETLLPERLGLTPRQIKKAKPFFLAMDQDLTGIE